MQMILTGTRSSSLDYDTSSWKPLLALAPGHIDDFMWMFEVECDDSTRIHAYKHWVTRRYLHLSIDGRAFVYVPDALYRQIDPSVLLDLVLA